LQHIGDARLELDEVDSDDSQTPRAVEPNRWVWPVVTAAAAGAAITLVTVWLLAPKPSAPVTRFTIPIPYSRSNPPTFGYDISLSPDGRTLVYVTATGLVRRRLDELSFEPIRGGEGGSSPFFSPDGAWIGFRSDFKLKKLPVDGGLAITIWDVPGVFKATWGDDGSIVLERSGDLYEVPSSGGTLRVLLKSNPSDGTFTQPSFMPGSRAVLVRRRSEGSGRRTGRIEAIERRTLARHSLVEGSHPQLASSGDLIFEQEGRIWAVKFDAKRLAVIGSPVPVVESVRTVAGQALFSASRDGSLAYISGDAGSHRSLVWIDRAGKTSVAIDAQGEFQSPRLSPDGQRVLVSVSDESSIDLWSYEFDRGTRLRLTTAGTNRRGVWSADGTQIAFYSIPQEGADQDLYVMASTGGEPKRLLVRPGPQFPDTWSPDGRFLVFEDGEQGTGARRDLWLLPIGEAPKPLLVTRFNERGAMFSPNGRWLAFVSDESGRPEIYVQPFPGPGSKVSISPSGGLQPMWSRDGRELFYREGDWLMVARIQQGPFAVSAPKKLFELSGAAYNFDPNFADYDIAPDGRVLAIRGDTASPDQIHVTLNWTEDLKQRVPTK
jgi:dipeptidyl aminopeptidase/acylaminoacyl peptidase